MVRTPYKRVNVLSFEMSLNIKFSSFGKSNILILDLKLLLQLLQHKTPWVFAKISDE